ncbi:MAG: hypothetical protein ACO3UW_12920 [Candidatus Nanopelagicales bacterium]
MPEPVTIEGIRDFGRVLRRAMGDHTPQQVAAAAGTEDRNVRRMMEASAMNPRTLIEVIAACGYRMEVHLIPVETAGSRRLAAIETEPATAYPRLLDLLSTRPGATAPDLARVAGLGARYTRRLLRFAVQSGRVWVMAGAKPNQPNRYWLPDPTDDDE